MKAKDDIVQNFNRRTEFFKPISTEGVKLTPFYLNIRKCLKKIFFKNLIFTT